MDSTRLPASSTIFCVATFVRFRRSLVGGPSLAAASRVRSLRARSRPRPSWRFGLAVSQPVRRRARRPRSPDRARTTGRDDPSGSAPEPYAAWVRGSAAVPGNSRSPANVHVSVPGRLGHRACPDLRHAPLDDCCARAWPRRGYVVDPRREPALARVAAKAEPGARASPRIRGVGSTAGVRPRADRPAPRGRAPQSLRNRMPRRARAANARVCPLGENRRGASRGVSLTLGGGPRPSG